MRRPRPPAPGCWLGCWPGRWLGRWPWLKI